MKIAIYGGSFNPPGKHHIEIVKQLIERFDLVLVVPCGYRPDKAQSEFVSPAHRKKMISLSFGDIYKVKIDFFDINNNGYTPTYLIEKKYSDELPNCELWHVIGSDLTENGSKGESQIQKYWHYGKDIWKNLNFFIINRPGYSVNQLDLPPKSILFNSISNDCSSSRIRLLIKTKQKFSDYVLLSVKKIIVENNLYL